MDQYVTGAVIRRLREKNHYTQAQLAEKLMVSDKTISKWETGKGYPDISLLEPLAECFHVSLTELFSGTAVDNANVSSNVMRSKFYVCPVCGNVIHSMGEMVIHCHGIQLSPLEAEESDEKHKIFIERSEDEYYIQIEHEMEKNHYISFIAALSSDRMELVKLYPEGEASARVRISGIRRVCYYCNRDGLFFRDVLKGIDDKERSYEELQERKELEETADLIPGKPSKKEMKQAYLNRRPRMGILALTCKETGESFLEASKDIQADINSITFKLSSGYHPNRKLLELWKKYGREGFEIHTLKGLSYEEDVSDYKEELNLLRDICLEEDPKAYKVWK